MSESKTQYFRTVEEMHAVPFEKIEAFVTDLKLWLQTHRLVEIEGNGALRVETPTDAFGWIDDGKHDVRIKLTLPNGLDFSVGGDPVCGDESADGGTLQPPERVTR